MISKNDRAYQNMQPHIFNINNRNKYWSLYENNDNYRFFGTPIFRVVHCRTGPVSV